MLGGVAAGAMTPGARAADAPRREPFLTDDWLEGLSRRYGTAADHAARRVLFVGNSITLQHDVPGRVAALARADGIPIETAMAAAFGARLSQTARIGPLDTLLAEVDWDVVVLQDHTTTPFRDADRAASAATMGQLAERAGARNVILYPPWPRGPGHSFYKGPPGDLDMRPRDPGAFASATIGFYRDVAEAQGFRVAPVPEAWLEAVADGRPVYGADAYHASPEGAALAARAIWERLKPALAGTA